jgi:hypothetical protein
MDEATRIVISGSITYVAKASPGTEYTQAAWQVKKIDESNTADVRITWADGDSKYDNKADNVVGLTYK